MYHSCVQLSCTLNTLLNSYREKNEMEFSKIGFALVKVTVFGNNHQNVKKIRRKNYQTIPFSIYNNMHYSSTLSTIVYIITIFNQR